MLNRGLALFAKVKHIHLPQSGGLVVRKSWRAVTDRLERNSSFGFTKPSSLFFTPRRGYANQMQTKKSISVIGKHTASNQTAQVPYKERTICWELSKSKTLQFRVTYRGIDGYDAERSSQWNIEGIGTVPAPFFNQEEVLLDMLRSVYYNEFRGSMKPKYAIQTMDSGSGKTRFLTEWIMHAFANPAVIKKFLDSAFDAPARKIRKQFLNALYWSSYKQHTIITSGSSWNAVNDEAPALQDAMLEVTSRTILERHNNQSIEFEGRSIVINSTTAKDFGFQLRPSTLVKLFIALADATYDDPPHLPFPSAGLLDKRIVFFSIDDCHALRERFDGGNKPDVLYRLFRGFAASHHNSEGVGVSPFWFAVGSHLRGRFFDLEGSQFQFDIGIPSLGSLLEIKYLAQICKQFIGHKLPPTYFTNTSDQPELPESIARALVCNYLKTNGNPRAVECFVRALVVNCKGISSSDWTRWNERMKLFSDQLNEQLSSIFPEQISGTDESVAKLNLAAALCSEMPYDQPMIGLAIGPKEMVTTGHMSVWKREQNDPLQGFAKFYLTRPFFSFSAAFLEKPILTSNASDTEHWRPHNISLASLVLHKDHADQRGMKGESFEVAVASALYARHTLKEKGVSLKDVFPAKSLPEKIREALRSINEKSTEVLDAIMQHQVIAVNEGNSDFADVLLPITLPGNVRSMVGIQCSKFPKPPIKNLVRSCKKVIDCGFFFAGIAPVHHNNEKFTAHLSAEQQNRAFLVKSSELISPLYLLGMNFCSARNR